MICAVQKLYILSQATDPSMSVSSTLTGRWRLSGFSLEVTHITCQLKIAETSCIPSMHSHLTMGLPYRPFKGPWLSFNQTYFFPPYGKDFPCMPADFHIPKWPATLLEQKIPYLTAVFNIPTSGHSVFDGPQEKGQLQDQRIFILLCCYNWWYDLSLMV